MEANIDNWNKPVAEEEIIFVLVDAVALRRDARVPDDNVAEVTLIVMAFPFWREAAASTCYTPRQLLKKHARSY